MKPKGFLVVTLLLILFFLTPLKEVIAPLSPKTLQDNLFTIGAVQLLIISTIFFGLGFNWARIIIQVPCFLIFMTGVDFLTSDIHRPKPFTAFDQVETLVESAFAFFMLYWLNTKKVRAYFRNRKTKANALKHISPSLIPPIAEPK